MNDCDIVIIDKTNPAEPTIRETYWINRLMYIYIYIYIYIKHEKHAHCLQFEHSGNGLMSHIGETSKVTISTIVTFILLISTTLMRPKRPKRYRL